ncbi:MAG: lactonase family protein [Chloroflexota bacterium]
MTQTVIAYVGTYTEDMGHVPESKGQGIHLMTFDLIDGKLTDTGSVCIVKNPSFLAIGKQQKYLYSVSEIGEGVVSAYAIDSTTGNLTFLNQQSAYGSAPAYVSIDHTKQFVFIANYVDGQSVVMLPTTDDGRLEWASDMHIHDLPASLGAPARQEKWHAHCIVPSPDNRFVFACDLGVDKVFIYRLDTDAQHLVPHDTLYTDLPVGAGPRHLVFHPMLDVVYVINELNNTVSVFDYDSTAGTLNPQQMISTLPANYRDANTTSDIHVSADGQHLYAANRGHDSLAIYNIDPQNGQLAFITHQPTGGRTPRNFTLDPSDNFVLVTNQDSHNIVVFRRDTQSGTLTEISRVDCPTPVCIKMMIL